MYLSGMLVMGMLQKVKIYTMTTLGYFKFPSNTRRSGVYNTRSVKRTGAASGCAVVAPSVFLAYVHSFRGKGKKRGWVAYGIIRYGTVRSV